MKKYNYKNFEYDDDLIEWLNENQHINVINVNYIDSYSQVNGVRRKHYHPGRYLLITYSTALEKEIHKEVSHDQYESLNVDDSIIHSYYVIKK
jgi:hypothetical protein